MHFAFVSPSYYPYIGGVEYVVKSITGNSYRIKFFGYSMRGHHDE